ncbi:heparanase [Sarracenia purpurea var. burkii]
MAQVIFGINALSGRSIQSNGSATGAWDFTNAKSFMYYTVKKGYTIYGWELGRNAICLGKAMSPGGSPGPFLWTSGSARASCELGHYSGGSWAGAELPTGNELSGSGVGVRVAADQYAYDTIYLQKVVQDIYKGIEPKPLVIGPGGFFDANWFEEFIDKTTKSLNVVTHHIYNLGPGVDEHLVEKILNPSYLDDKVDAFNKLQNTLKTSATSAIAWVGEAGGAYNSGRNFVTNAFVFSFW